MAAVQSGFPDLDAALTISRVEVVSNVEIETIKGALRWLFTELQQQRAPATADGMTVTPEQLNELRKSSQEQKALLTAVQEQQVPSMPPNDATYAALKVAAQCHTYANMASGDSRNSRQTLVWLGRLMSQQHNTDVGATSVSSNLLSPSLTLSCGGHRQN